MRVTVFGAGAIGTLFAAKLADARHAVVVVARGARKASLETRGLVLRARGSTVQRVVRVPVHERLAEVPEADFILVTLRAQQVDAQVDAAMERAAARGGPARCGSGACADGVAQVEAALMRRGPVRNEHSPIQPDGVSSRHYAVTSRRIRSNSFGDRDSPPMTERRSRGCLAVHTSRCASRA